MASYNHEPYVVAAIRSVQSQTMPFDRIVFFSDGSTDRTLELAREAWGNDPRVEYLDDLATNRGLVARLTDAFSRVRDGMVILSSGDDLVYPNAVQLHREALLRTGRQWSMAGMDIIDHENRLLRRVGPNAAVQGSRHAAYRAVLGMDPFHPHGHCIRASLFHQIGGYGRAGLVDDYTLYLKIAWAEEPAVSTEVVAAYRKVPGSLTEARNEQMWLECARIAFGEVRRAPVPALAATSKWLVSAALSAAKGACFARALRHFVVGFVLWPAPSTIRRTVTALRRYLDRKYRPITDISGIDTR